MAGLDRKVLNSRRITKIMAPSNPVFNRSFVTSFGVAFYKWGRNVVHNNFPSLFLPCAEKIIHLHRKTNKTITRQ